MPMKMPRELQDMMDRENKQLTLNKPPVTETIQDPKKSVKIKDMSKKGGAFTVDQAKSLFVNGFDGVYCVRTDLMKVILCLSIEEAVKFYGEMGE